MPTEREHHTGPFIFSTDPDLTQKPSVGTKWYSPAEIQSREIISYERPQDKMVLDIRIDRGTISLLGRSILFAYSVMMGGITLVFAEAILNAHWWTTIILGISLIISICAFYSILGTFVFVATDITFESVRSAITKLEPILDKVNISEFSGRFPCVEEGERALKN